MMKRCALFLCCVLLVSGCASKKTPETKLPETRQKASQKPYTVMGHRYEPLQTHAGFVQTGVASWYGKDFHGKRTSNGEKYDMNAMTAAHKTLPLGVFVKVRNTDNGHETVVRVNDRGPFVKGRIIRLCDCGSLVPTNGADMRDQSWHPAPGIPRRDPRHDAFDADEQYGHGELFAGERNGPPLARTGGKALLRGLIILAALGGGWALVGGQSSWPDWLRDAIAAVSSSMDRGMPARVEAARSAMLTTSPPTDAERTTKPPVLDTPPAAPQTPASSKATAPPGAAAAPTATPLATAAPHLRPQTRKSRRPHHCHRQLPIPPTPTRCVRWPSAFTLTCRASCWRDFRQPTIAMPASPFRPPWPNFRQRRLRLAASAHARACTVPGALRARRRPQLPALRRDGDQGRLVDDGAADGEVRPPARPAAARMSSHWRQEPNNEPPVRFSRPSRFADARAIACATAPTIVGGGITRERDGADFYQL